MLLPFIIGIVILILTAVIKFSYRTGYINGMNFYEKIVKKEIEKNNFELSKDN